MELEGVGKWEVLLPSALPSLSCPVHPPL